MNFKKAKVVMLPTNQQTKYLMVYSDVEKTKGKLILNGLKNDEYKEYQHLYIISDNEIKEGDWLNRDNEIHQCFKSHETDIEFKTNKDSVYFGTNTFWNKKYCKKIIATTDESLYYKDTSKNPKQYMGSYMSMSLGENLPQPSQQFIQKYIEEYNKGNVIEDVLVEYGIIYKGRSCDLYNPNKLKVNFKDNTITIEKSKDSWNREEVENLIYSAMKDRCYTTVAEWQKWIKENL